MSFFQLYQKERSIMYRSRKPFSYSGRNSFRANRSFRGNFSKRKIVTFDPSLLVRKTFSQAPQEATYVVKNNFSDFGINENLKQNIINKGYKIPTPIQDQVIPYILAGKDVIGQANTGTGKTAAFLIPLINKIIKQRFEKILIITPTRELASQIQQEFNSFVKNLKIYSSLCIGGASMNNQVYSLKSRPNVVIGTPGRLIDLEKRHVLDFASYATIVLDEVDKMFDMGFKDSMNYIIERLAAQRQSLFFSATLPEKMNIVISKFLDNPVKVVIQSQKTAHNIEQEVIRIKGQSKIDLLNDLLKQEGFDKVLIFGRTKYGLDKLSRILFEKGFKVATIHGNKNQNQRQKALQQFKGNRVQILLATDIASRGLDINNVTHVINYDLPQTYEDYIHRIGRTGRANKTGVALSFVE